MSINEKGHSLHQPTRFHTTSAPVWEISPLFQLKGAPTSPLKHTLLSYCILHLPYGICNAMLCVLNPFSSSESSKRILYLPSTILFSPIQYLLTHLESFSFIQFHSCPRSILTLIQYRHPIAVPFNPIWHL